jgi:hypothetical protein
MDHFFGKSEYQTLSPTGSLINPVDLEGDAGSARHPEKLRQERYEITLPKRY